jgi:hypothetical protein
LFFLQISARCGFRDSASANPLIHTDIKGITNVSGACNGRNAAQNNELTFLFCSIPSKLRLGKRKYRNDCDNPDQQILKTNKDYREENKERSVVK